MLSLYDLFYFPLISLLSRKSSLWFEQVFILFYFIFESFMFVSLIVNWFARFVFPLAIETHYSS